MARRPPSSTSNVCLYLLAIFISPVPVLIRTGCGIDFWINVVLFVTTWILGVLHGFYVISRSERAAQTGHIHSAGGHHGQPVYNQPPPQQHMYDQPPPQQQMYNQPPPQQQMYNQPPPKGGYATGAGYGAPTTGGSYGAPPKY